MNCDFSKQEGVAGISTAPDKTWVTGKNILIVGQYCTSGAEWAPHLHIQREI